MKKFTALIIVFMLAFSFVSCKTDKGDDNGNNGNNETGENGDIGGGVSLPFVPVN